MKKIELEQENQELKLQIKRLDKAIQNNQKAHEELLNRAIEETENKFYNQWKSTNAIFVEKLFEELISNLHIETKTSGGGYVDIALKYKDKLITNETFQVEMDRNPDEW